MARTRITPGLVDQKAEEQGAFDLFLLARPEIAHELRDFTRVPDAEFPDIQFRSPSGEVIGFELTEWISEKRVHSGKRRERLAGLLEDCFRGIPGSYFGAYALSLEISEPATLPTAADLNRLKERAPKIVVSLVSKTQWEPERTVLLLNEEDLIQAGFPRGLLVGANLIRTAKPVGGSRVSFMDVGGAFSPEDVFQDLCSCIERKLNSYASSSAKKVTLIVYRSQGEIYELPYRAAGDGSWKGVAVRLEPWLQSKSVCFPRIYLLRAVEPKPEAFLIYSSAEPEIE